MLLKQKLKLIFIFYFTVNYSKAIQRDVRKENEVFINKLFLVKDIVAENFEKSQDLICKSIPQEIRQHLFIAKNNNDKLTNIINDMSEDSSKQKSLNIGAILDYVDQSFIQTEKLSKTELLLKTFKELNNFIFTNDMSTDIKNKTIKDVNKVIDLRLETNKKIKEFKSRLLTGLNSQDFEDLEKKIENSKKNAKNFISVVKNNLEYYTADLEVEKKKMQESHTTEEQKKELEDFIAYNASKKENMTEITENYIVKHDQCCKTIEILEQMKDLLKTISVSEYTSLFHSKVKKKIAKFYILRREIIPDYLKILGFEGNAIKKLQNLLTEEAELGSELSDIMIRSQPDGVSKIDVKFKYSTESIIANNLLLFASLKAEMLVIIYFIIQAYKVLDMHYKLYYSFTNYIFNDYAVVLNEVRLETKELKLEQNTDL